MIPYSILPHNSLSIVQEITLHTSTQGLRYLHSLITIVLNYLFGVLEVQFVAPKTAGPEKVNKKSGPCARPESPAQRSFKNASRLRLLSLLVVYMYLPTLVCCCWLLIVVLVLYGYCDWLQWVILVFWRCIVLCFMVSCVLWWVVFVVSCVLWWVECCCR